MAANMTMPMPIPTEEEQAKAILAAIDKGATIGVAYLGVAISSMCALVSELLHPLVRALTVGQDLRCNLHPDVPVLPLREGQD